MDLRPFQDRSQTQANLGQIPAPIQQQSTLQTVLGGVNQLAPVIGQAFVKGAQAEAETASAKDVGSFTLKLAKAAQASETDPNFDLVKAQRKIFQETVAANPALADEYIKTFKSATGLEPAGLTAEQQQLQKDLFEAQSKNFGDPNDPPEVQRQQLELYQDIQREAVIMEHEAKREARDKKEAQREVYKRTAKMVGLKTESLNLALEQDLEAIRNGANREEITTKWLKWRTANSVEFAQYGEFANDPVVKAQIQGITDTFDLADKMLSGQVELDATQRETELIVAKSKAIIAADPEAATLIGASEFFRNQPTLTLPINNLIRRLMTQGPSDLRGVPAAELEAGKGTILRMGSSEDPKTREEAQGYLTDTAKHLGRNGEDYTDEEILQTCSFLAVPSVYETMTSGQQDQIARACSDYAVDVAQRSLRELEQNSSINVREEVLTPRGDTRFSEVTVLAANNFSSLEVDENGFRYVATNEFQNNRQARRQIQSMNRLLDKVNPVLTVLAKSTGKTVEQVAGEVFGLGPQAATTTLPEQPVSIQDRLLGWYEENFTQPSTVATEQEREAQARQLGQSFLDLFDPVKMGVIKTANAGTGDTGEFSSSAGESVVPGSPVDNVVNNILSVEGVGDDVTDVPTGIGGITPKALSAIGVTGIQPEDLTEEQALSAARAYTQQLDQDFTSNLEGYSTLSPRAQEAILDTAYNLGPEVTNFSKFSEAVKAGDEQEAMKQLLDTANVDSKSMRGIAKRRANNYNRVADVPITTIEQKEDGTLVYLDSDDNVIFSYKPKGGRHEQSAVGRIPVG